MHNEFVLVAFVLHLVLYSPVHQPSIDVSSCGQQVAVKTGPNNKMEESPLVVWVVWRNMIPYALCRGLWYAYRYSMDVYGFRKELANFCGEEIGIFSTSGACGFWIN